jgi:hypothetical protein
VVEEAPVRQVRFDVEAVPVVEVSREEEETDSVDRNLEEEDQSDVRALLDPALVFVGSIALVALLNAAVLSNLSGKPTFWRLLWLQGVVFINPLLLTLAWKSGSKVSRRISRTI